MRGKVQKSWNDSDKSKCKHEEIKGLHATMRSPMRLPFVIRNHKD